MAKPKPKTKPKIKAKAKKTMARKSKAEAEAVAQEVKPVAAETVEAPAEATQAEAAENILALPPEVAEGEAALDEIVKAEGSVADKWIAVGRALHAIERLAMGNKDKPNPRLLGQLVARTKFASIPSVTRSDAKWLAGVDAALTKDDPRENATGEPMVQVLRDAGVTIGHPSNTRGTWRNHLAKLAADKAKAEEDRLMADPEAKAAKEAEEKAAAAKAAEERAYKAALRPDEVAILADMIGSLGKKAAQAVAMDIARCLAADEPNALFRDIIEERKAQREAA